MWSAADESPARRADAIATHGRNHSQKYLETVLFGAGLDTFWGDFLSVEDCQQEDESWEEVAEVVAVPRKRPPAKQTKSNNAASMWTARMTALSTHPHSSTLERSRVTFGRPPK